MSTDEQHHPMCYQVIGVPGDLPPDLCDCETLRRLEERGAGKARTAGVRVHEFTDETLAAHDAQVRREAKAEALREAADEWQTGGWADDMPAGTSRPALILGMAQRAANYLRTRADRIEREGGEE